MTNRNFGAVPGTTTGQVFPNRAALAAADAKKASALFDSWSKRVGSDQREGVQAFLEKRKPNWQNK